MVGRIIDDCLAKKKTALEVGQVSDRNERESGCKGKKQFVLRSECWNSEVQCSSIMLYTFES